MSEPAGGSSWAGRLELAEFVSELRGQLRAAAADADPQMPIELGQVSVELTIATSKEGGVNAGVKFWVVEAGGSGKVGSASTQKVTLTFQPLNPEGTGNARIRDQR